MRTRWIALLGAVAMLAACAHPSAPPQAKESWNGGTWNSVLGYHGPANATVAGGPSR